VVVLANDRTEKLEKALSRFGSNEIYTNLMLKAIGTNLDRDITDSKYGVSAPGECSLPVYLETAMSAVGCGISTKDWNCVAEGLAMLIELLDRIET
jgi:hypothetical protein